MREGTSFQDVNAFTNGGRSQPFLGVIGSARRTNADYANLPSPVDSASPMYNVSAWRCECGTNLKAVTQLNKDDRLHVFFVDCPVCGKKQIVHGYELVSITKEKSGKP